MKLTFIGTGSAFTVGDACENYQSNMVLEADSHKKMLIDCGSDARFALYEQGVSSHELQDIYISHLHADHIGGLEWFAFTSKHNPNGSFKSTLHLSYDLVEDLWNRALSAGLNPSQDPAVSISTFFDLDVISDRTFKWEGITFHLFPTLHIASGSWRMPSYGLWFKGNQKNVLITTDTQFDLDSLEKLYHQADIIFQDCETAPSKSGVHAHYSELKLLSPEIKSKMWLYHYQPGLLPNAKSDGFKGFVRKGQCFDL